MTNLNCKCILCSKEFYLKPFAVKRGRGGYCSRRCQRQHKTILRTKVVNCSFCFKEFNASLSRINRGSAKHCSKRCAGLNRERDPEKTFYKECPECYDVFSFKANDLKYRDCLHCSLECRNAFYSKDKHPKWNPNKTEEQEIRHSREYKLWRLYVFERDGYTCKQCGDSRGGNLEAHHIKDFLNYPELRLDINNGTTLCQSCHKKTDTWGAKNKRKNG